MSALKPPAVMLQYGILPTPDIVVGTAYYAWARVRRDSGMSIMITGGACIDPDHARTRLVDVFDAARSAAECMGLWRIDEEVEVL